MKNGFTITQRNAVVEQHLWCIDTVVAQYAAFMQTEPVDPDDVYQSLAVRLIRAVNSYDPRKGYLEEYILSLSSSGRWFVSGVRRLSMD